MSLSNLVSAELTGLYGQKTLEEMGQIIRLYEFYDGAGQAFAPPADLDYQPTMLVTNLCKKLIKRESRFMFGRTPELRIRSLEGELLTEFQHALERVLEGSRFPEKLLKGLRDCLIGKRVAVKITGGRGTPTAIHFRPSLEFVFEPFEDDADRLKKIIFFYRTNNEMHKRDQRIWKQKYEMTGGRCLLCEGLYDGFGGLTEGGDVIDTGLDFIPCYVIINDGLIGDLSGESDVLEIMDNQNAYNRLKSDDIDALKFNMFPQRVAVDADGSSLENMTISPGSLVDLVTDPARDDNGAQASLTMLESHFSYDGRFEHTLNRIKQDMHELLGVPNLSLEQLQGLAQSGRSMKALYWELIERSEERWTAWEPALRWMCRTVLLFESKFGELSSGEDTPFNVAVEHLYPILEDEENERELDLREVTAGVRTPESYREKWQVR
ncbi:MAG: phage portal protein [Oscillospiraceae bacterium]|nr:phage portal protein [Oscillospiraceae bacterium]